MSEKIVVDKGDWGLMEKLIEDGSANQDDWQEFVDASVLGSYWPGFIYKNLDSSPVEPAVVGSSGSEPTWVDEFEEFHFCDAGLVASGNPCHGADGKFCQTGGSSGGGSSSAVSPSGAPYFTPLLGRSLVPGQKVKIYRNLHKVGVAYSVRDAKTGLVLGHTTSIILNNVVYEVHEAGRQKVLSEKKKNVHSFVVGEYAGPFGEAQRSAFLGDAAKEAVSYNPYRSGSYYKKGPGGVPGADVQGAASVIVDKTGVYQLAGAPKRESALISAAVPRPIPLWRGNVEFYNRAHDSQGRFTGPGIAGKVVSEVKAVGGATLQPGTGRAVVTGYAVGLGSTHPGTEYNEPIGQFTASDVSNWLHRKAVKGLFASNRSAKIGVWEDAGKIYLEPSQRVSGRDQAIRLGKKRNQIGIQHLVPHGEGYIPTGGTGG